MLATLLLDSDAPAVARARIAQQSVARPLPVEADLRSERSRSYATWPSPSVPISHTDTWPDITSIRIAETEEQRRMARALLHRMYRRRGYSAALTEDDESAPRALIASDYARGNPIATLTLHVDGQDGLHADRLYGNELDALRAQGRQLCETIRLAADPAIRKSRRLMAALFHVTFLQAYRANCCTDLVIEVTPRHAAFYRRMLQFEILGDIKWNPRVKTSGVLLRLDLDKAAERIRRCTGQMSTSLARSLYPWVLPASQESVVFQRIMSREPLLVLVG